MEEGPLLQLCNYIISFFMDPEQQARCLLAPTPEQLASVQVFPLIHSLKREVTVSVHHLPRSNTHLFLCQNTIGVSTGFSSLHL